MEYYDHNNMWGRPNKSYKENSTRYKNDPRAYDSMLRYNGKVVSESVEKYQDYRKRYRGYGRNHSSYGREKRSYFCEDRDLRMMENDESPPYKKHRHYSYDKEMKYFQPNEHGSGSSSSDSSKLGKRIKQEPQQMSPIKYDNDDENEHDSDENDLSKELHPISYYLETDDREEMLIQVFKVISGTKLRAMLPPILKDMDLAELKVECLKQLEGMSKKRLQAVFVGEELDDSSDTDEEENDRKNGIRYKADHNKCSKGRIDPEKLVHSKAAVKKEKNVSGTRERDINKNVKEEKIRKKIEEKCVLGNISDAIQFKSSSKSSKKFRVTSNYPILKSSSSEEDLEAVIESRNKERKRKQSQKETSIKKEKDSKSKLKKDSSSNNQLIKDEIAKNLLNDDESGKTLMELLELEMRARAIKALLEKKTSAEDSINKVSENETNLVESGDKQHGSNEVVEQKNENVIEEDLQRKRQIQKAKEQLHISEAKKREEEELIERKHEEIRKQLEEQQKLKESQEVEEERKKALEAERKLKAQKKKEEHEKFLIWKDERQRKKEEKEALKLKLLMEKEKTDREKVRNKIHKMHEREEKSPESLYRWKSKTKPRDVVKPSNEFEDNIENMNTEDEEDDLNRLFDITFDASFEEGEIRDSCNPSDTELQIFPGREQNTVEDYLQPNDISVDLPIGMTDYISNILLELIPKVMPLTNFAEESIAGELVSHEDQIGTVYGNDHGIYEYICSILLELVSKIVPPPKYLVKAGTTEIVPFKDHIGMVYYKDLALKKYNETKYSPTIDVTEPLLSGLEVIMYEYNIQENIMKGVIDPQIDYILSKVDKKLFSEDPTNAKQIGYASYISATDLGAHDPSRGELSSICQDNNEVAPSKSKADPVSKNDRQFKSSSFNASQLKQTGNPENIDDINLRRIEISRNNKRRKCSNNIKRGEVDSDGESIEAIEDSRDPKKRMILHHMPKRQKKDKTAINGNSAKLEEPCLKKDKEGSDIPSSLSKKMIRQAQRIERMKAFANQSDMQNLFHGNDPARDSNNLIEDNNPYTYFSKERYIDETGDPSLTSRIDIEEKINGTIVDNCLNENEPGDKIVNENVEVDSNDQSCSKNKGLDINESQSEEEESEEDNDLWNTIMGKKN